MIRKLRYNWFAACSQRELGGRTRWGLLLTVAAQFGGTILQFLSTAVLARLLDIADFGLVAMSALVNGFAGMFLAAGLGVATVQKAVVSARQVSALFWVNIAIGVFLGLLVFAISPLAAWFFGEPRLEAVLCVSAIVFPITAGGVQHAALLTRHSLFGRLATRDLFAQLSGVVVGIFTGFMGFGYWSLVFAGIASATGGTLLAWALCPWLPGWPSRNAGIGGMLRFGSGMLAFNFVNYWGRNADNLLIGRLLGAEALGVYGKAYGLLLMPLSKVVRPLGRVLMPHLSRIADDLDLFRSVALRSLGALAFVVSPAVSLLGVLSPEVIRIMLGPGWTEAVPIFQWLVLSGIAQATLVPTGEILAASGRSDLLLRAGIVGVCINLSAFVVGIQWGVVGVAACYGVTSLLVGSWVRLWFLSLTKRFRVGELWIRIMPPLMIAGGASLLGTQARWWLGYSQPSVEGAAIGLVGWSLGASAIGFVPSAWETWKLVFREVKSGLSGMVQQRPA